jgi:hypothetical protein
MAKTAAERQKTYRAQRQFAGKNGSGERRVNTWVNTQTALGLERLARHHGVTKKEIIERLVSEAEDKVLERMKKPSPEWYIYLSGEVPA